MTTDIGTLLNLACIKYTGQSLPNCGDELPTEWKYVKVDGRRISTPDLYWIPSPLTLRPSSNSSIELDIKRMMIVSDLKSIFSHRENKDTAKFGFQIINERNLNPSDQIHRENILYIMGFTKEQIELIVERIGELPYGVGEDAFLLVLYKLGIPYDSKGVEGFLKLKEDRYKYHPEVSDPYARKTKILDTYSSSKPEHFETKHTIEKRFWYGKEGGRVWGRDDRWSDRHSEPHSVQFRLENPDNYRKDEHLKKGKKFQLDYLNRKLARDGALSYYRNPHQKTLIGGTKVIDDWVHTYGREWMDEGKLDTKTLLRVYADKRESYEEVVKRISFV